MTVKTLSPAVESKEAGKSIFWKEWAILTVAGMLATLAAIPGQWSAILQVAQTRHQTLAQVLGPQIVSAPFQAAIIVGLGLFFAKRVALGAPILEGWLQGKKVGAQLKSILVPSVGLGVIGALIAAAVNQWIFLPLLPGFSTLISQVGGWQGLLASLYGGVGEELFLRLCLLSIFAWIFSQVRRTANQTPASWSIWVAMILSAAVFSIGHLPATSLSVEITPLIVVRSFALNGGLGLLYGVLYWKRGFESAVLAHFSSDIVLHFMLPLFL